MYKGKKKIERSYKDFYTAEDLRDPDTRQRINLTIDDFDEKGRIANPRAPCVVTTVDPNYVKDASQQRLVKKFRMKTDILHLREITRKKFMIYSTQQRFLEKQREAEFQEREYKRITDFFKFAEQSLTRMEAHAFSDMMKANQQLKELKELKLEDELKDLIAEHQRIQMEVQETYGRFLYLLKLVGYFDNIEDYSSETNHIDVGRTSTVTPVLQKPADLSNLLGEKNSKISMEHIEQLKEYMNRVVRPYLAQKNHLKADIWIQGYEYTRRKIFNYSRHLTNVALLNHILSIVFEKYQKTNARRMTKAVCLKDPTGIQQRVDALKLRANQIFSKFEVNYKTDKLNLKLNFIIPVILKQVEAAVGQDTHENTLNEMQKKEDDTCSCCNEQDSTLLKVEKIHAIVMSLLQKLESFLPNDIKRIEQQVRRRVRIEKDKSRKALIKQTNTQNWIAHFRKHELLNQK